MLTKLIKNEFKTSSHSVLNVYLAALITVAFMTIAYAININWVGLLSSIAMLLIGFASVLVTFVAVITNYNKSIFGAQGYLTLALPVKTRQLLFSKAFVSFCWLFFSYVFSIVTVFGVTAYLRGLAGEETVGIIQTTLEIAGFPSAAALRNIVIFILFLILAQILALIAQIFFAITISNVRLLQPLGNIGAILVFFGVYVIMAVIILLLTLYVPIYAVIYEDGISFVFSNARLQEMPGTDLGIAGIIFQLFATGGLFYLTGITLKNKVNVK